MTEISGWPRTVRSGLIGMRPARSVLRADRARERARRPARPERPPPRPPSECRSARASPSVSIVTPRESIAVARTPWRTSTPSSVEPARRLRRERLAERRQHAVTGVEQDDPHLVRADAREVLCDRLPRQDRERARHLDAGRAAADDRERQPLRAGLGVGRPLGLLERAEDPVAQVDRVRERLQPARHVLPLVVAEVGRLHPAGEDQAVVADPLAALEDDLPLLDVEVHDLGHQHPGARIAPQRDPDRRRALARRHRAECHLVEQRLEQVVVLAVDHRHVDVGVLQPPRRRQPAEPAADDHDPAPRSGRSVSRHSRAPVAPCATPIRSSR